jgi:Arc/MetJ family transcription regulator
MEEPLVMEAQAITGIKTKTGVVHYALREVVRRAKQKEILKFRGKVAWDGDLDQMRKPRR